MVDIDQQRTTRKREFRALDRAEVDRHHQIDIAGWRFLLIPLGAAKEADRLGDGVGAVPRDLLPERLEPETEREARADGVRIGIAMAHDRDAARPAQCVQDLLHRCSRSRASRRRRATRTARSAERSGTKVSSGTKRRSVREPSSRRRKGLAFSSAAIVFLAASSSPSTLTNTRALRRSSVISTSVTVGTQITGIA